MVIIQIFAARLARLPRYLLLRSLVLEKIFRLPFEPTEPMSLGQCSGGEELRPRPRDIKTSGDPA